MKKSTMVNHIQADSDDDSDDAPSVFSKKDVGESSGLGFIAEQHKALLALLQQHSGGTPGPSANRLASSIPNSKSLRSGIVLQTSNSHDSDSWILDTGAIDHVCKSLSFFKTYKRISPIIINLPDHSQVISYYLVLLYSILIST
jgi:hypothetical protein